MREKRQKITHFVKGSQKHRGGPTIDNAFQCVDFFEDNVLIIKFGKNVALHVLKFVVFLHKKIVLQTVWQNVNVHKIYGSILKHNRAYTNGSVKVMYLFVSLSKTLAIFATKVPFFYFDVKNLGIE